MRRLISLSVNSSAAFSAAAFVVLRRISRATKLGRLDSGIASPDSKPGRGIRYRAPAVHRLHPGSLQMTVETRFAADFHVLVKPPAIIDFVNRHIHGFSLVIGTTSRRGSVPGPPAKGGLITVGS